MFIHPQSKSIVLKVRNPQAILSALPKFSRQINVPEGNIAVKHSIDTVTVLRNLGIKAPSPIVADYPWPGKFTPFDHQIAMADFLTTTPKGFNLSDMGVGKTYATLWAADYLMSKGLVKRALVLAPLSTLETVWQRDLFNILMHRKGVITHGDREHRANAFAMDVDFYICNHDGISLKDVARIVRKRKDIDLIILDEASFFRNSQTTKYKYLAWAIEDKPRFWPMTGTPYANGPTDAWALSRLVSPHRVPKFFGAFKRMTMVQVSQFKYVPKKGAEEIAFNAMQPAVRFKKSECLSLPPVVTLDRQATLTQAQRDAYKTLRDDMMMQSKSGPIHAVNAADALNKLRQVLCGAIKNPGADTYDIIDHAPRVNELVNAINEAAAKVIVIVPFKGIIQSLENELKTKFSVAVLNGDVSIGRRNRIIEAFKTGTDPHILLCHPKVMSHGLNLTEADTIIFYAPIYSHDEYSQVIERFNRTGQTRKMRVIRIAAHPLEWDIYRLVDNKAITQDNILRLYREVTQ
jgi:SNF2 family DNA or RNA helicase